MVVEDGNVGITGELKIETMPEGKNTDDMVVWDKNDKSLKVVPRVFSKASPLSEPLVDSKNWHSISYDQVDDEGNIINASVQGTAANWNVFTTDNGEIRLGPANSYYAHIYTDRTRFLFNKPLTFSDAKFGSQANQSFNIQTGGLNRLTIHGTSGDVGIGATNPGRRLHIENNDTPSIRLFQDNSIWPQQIWDIRANEYSFWIKDVTAGTIPFRIDDNAPNNSFHIEGNGYVGLGTSAPNQKLTVANGAINITNPPSDKALYVDGAEALWYDGSRFSWGFGGNHNYFARKVGIGTIPGTMLDVRATVGTGAGLIVNIENKANTTIARGIRVTLKPATPATSNHYVEFTDNGGSSWAGYITGNGTGGVLYSSFSDARLKMNIVDSPMSALEKVSKIRVRQYETKAAPGIEELGFIAQELQEIYPESVVGNPLDDVETGPMAIDYGRITPLLVKAIQELQAEIEILKGR